MMDKDISVEEYARAQEDGTKENAFSEDREVGADSEDIARIEGVYRFAYCQWPAMERG